MQLAIDEYESIDDYHGSGVTLRELARHIVVSPGGAEAGRSYYRRAIKAFDKAEAWLASGYTCWELASNYMGQDMKEWRKQYLQEALNRFSDIAFV